jgi:ATP-dependent Clp protease ATP-binding subunit ClpA
VQNTLAEMILKGEIPEGAKVKISADGKNLGFAVDKSSLDKSAA